MNNTDNTNSNAVQPGSEKNELKKTNVEDTSTLKEQSDKTNNKAAENVDPPKSSSAGEEEKDITD